MGVDSIEALVFCIDKGVDFQLAPVAGVVDGIEPVRIAVGGFDLFNENA